MTIDRTALRALAQKAREDAKLIDQIVGDVGTHEAVQLADAIDALLAEVVRLETDLGEVKLVIEQQDRTMDADRKRVAELEAELHEVYSAARERDR